MFNTKRVFTSTRTPPTTSYAKLGDGKTLLEMKETGTATLIINGHTISLGNSWYVPDLEENLYSILEHARSPGQSFYSEDNTHILTWPNLKI